MLINNYGAVAQIVLELSCKLSQSQAYLPQIHLAHNFIKSFSFRKFDYLVLHSLGLNFDHYLIVSTRIELLSSGQSYYTVYTNQCFHWPQSCTKSP